MIPQQSSAHFQITHPDSHLLCSFLSLSRSLFLLPTVLRVLVTHVHNEAENQRKGNCWWVVLGHPLKKGGGELLLNYVLFYTVLYCIIFFSLSPFESFQVLLFFLFFFSRLLQQKESENWNYFPPVVHFSSYELSLLPPMLYVVLWPLSLCLENFSSFFFFFLHVAISNLFFKPLSYFLQKPALVPALCLFWILPQLNKLRAIWGSWEYGQWSLQKKKQQNFVKIN